jgi:hypothetical protein
LIGETMAHEKREKVYTVSERLVFSSIIVVLIVVLLLSAAAVGVIPLTHVTTTIPVGYTTTISNSGAGGTSTIPVTTTVAPIIVEAACSPTNASFACRNPFFNYTTGVLTIAIRQTSGYNWTRVTVRFVTAGTVYAESAVPQLSWSPPAAVNVTGGLLNNTLRYVNIPISSGPVAVGTNITGSIWAKYQLEIGGRVSYANMSSAWIVVKRGS